MRRINNDKKRIIVGVIAIVLFFIPSFSSCMLLYFKAKSKIL